MAIGVGLVSLAIEILSYSTRPLSDIGTIRVAAGIACSLLSVAWVALSAKILAGTRRVWQEYKEAQEPVPDTVLTGWIVRTVAGYRKNRGMFRSMIPVCLVCGFSFLILAVTVSLESASLSLPSGSLTFSAGQMIPLALVTLIIALVSLASAWYFVKFAEVSDGRQQDVERDVQELERSLRLGKV
jgi:hypothetical protein